VKRAPAAVLLGLAVGACAPAAAPPPAASEHELGRRVYNARCYFCHGYSGDARTVAARYLAPPPRDFRSGDPAALDPAHIERTLREGRPGTAMASFAGVLSERELRAVARFVHREFVLARARNTRYHTAENGWPDHERYRAAFAFATGEIPADTPYERLDAGQAAGKRLFLSACITCHEGGERGPAQWAPRAVSYPANAAACLSCHNREGVAPERAGAGAARHFSVTYAGKSPPADGGDPHSLHDRALRLTGLSPRERRGERLYQANCAFCHAADGTGRNWIGSFLDPRPADFTDPAVRARVTGARLREAVREGVPGGSMPAWKSVLSNADIEAVAAYVERAFLRPEPRGRARP
jgi:cytochrome c oxidase cbb3-type subunit 3